MSSFFIYFVALAAIYSSSHALYFHMGESETKCFLEEVPDETMIVGIYKVEMYSPETQAFAATQNGFGMHVSVKDPDQKVILSRVYSSEGRFAFTTHTPGEHLICLNSNSTKWFGGGKMRIHLDMEVGDHAIDYAKVGAKEKLSDLQLRVRQLIDQVESIQKEQNYQRTREERFRETSDTTNTRVLWWSLAQILVLICTGLWQVQHLKSFFRQKKLV